MKTLFSILESLNLDEAVEIHDELNPAIWDQDHTLKPDVRQAILDLVAEFSEQLVQNNIPLKLMDVVIVGSQASYNYNEFSDLDIHLLAGYSDVTCDPAILGSLYQFFKTWFNSKYDVKIKGISAELYVEDINTTVVSNGIYSVMQNAWLKVPEKITPPDVDISTELAFRESQYADATSENPTVLPEDLLNDLYLSRKVGLATAGEFSVGNLVFKEFRNSGKLDHLKDLIAQEKSKELTLEGLSDNGVNEAQMQMIDGYYVTKQSATKFLVQSPKGDEYEVTKKDKNWNCTCPAFKYHQKCKHIQMLTDQGLIKPEKIRQPIEKMADMKKVITPIFNSLVGPEGEKWEIVGSYRRGKDTFKDVDILVQCDEETFRKLGDELLKNPKFTRETGSGTAGSKSDKAAIFRGKYTEGDLEIELDVSRVNTDSPSAFLLYRTGPAELNQFMRVVAMSKGWSLSEKGLLDHVTGQKVSVKQDTEEDIFKALGLPYLTPQERETWQKQWDIEGINRRVAKDLRANIVDGPNSIIPELAEAIKKAINDPNVRLLDRVNSSKSEKGRAQAVLYYVKKYCTEGIAKYPYATEMLRAWNRATGENVQRSREG